MRRLLVGLAALFILVQGARTAIGLSANSTFEFRTRGHWRVDVENKLRCFRRRREVSSPSDGRLSDVLSLLQQRAWPRPAGSNPRAGFL